MKIRQDRENVSNFERILNRISLNREINTVILKKEPLFIWKSRRSVGNSVVLCTENH